MNPGINKDVLSVSRLNSEIRAVIDGSFPLLWVEGEISNLARPRSGHLYFSLKDAHTQVRCAMFRNKRLLLRSLPRDGDKVLLRAKISVYEARGDLQLIVEHMEPAGEGDLQRAFDALKKKLDDEGLFSIERKRTLPRFPRRIGIITSPQGAAVQDVLHVLKRRFPATDVIIYPTAVQGVQAPGAIIQALDLAAHQKAVDLLILTRGGGSLEDLMAFNDETVARNIAAMTIPVISAVGHEVDFTIADFVADKRAPTPSAAAEISVPDQAEVNGQFEHLINRLQREIASHVYSRQQQLNGVQQRLQRLHPLGTLRQQQQRIDELSLRLERSLKSRLHQDLSRLRNLTVQLNDRSPARKIIHDSEQASNLLHRLHVAMQHRLGKHQSALTLLARQLHALSPLAVLSRGFSLTRVFDTKQLIRSSSEIQPGDKIETRFATGSVTSRIEEIKS